MDDLEYIKQFGKITITDACNKAKVNKANLYAGRVKNQKQVNLVRKNIESDIAKLYIKKEELKETKGE